MIETGEIAREAVVLLIIALGALGFNGVVIVRFAAKLGAWEERFSNIYDRLERLELADRELAAKLERVREEMPKYGRRFLDD